MSVVEIYVEGENKKLWKQKSGNLPTAKEVGYKEYGKVRQTPFSVSLKQGLSIS